MTSLFSPGLGIAPRSFLAQHSPQLPLVGGAEEEAAPKSVTRIDTGASSRTPFIQPGTGNCLWSQDHLGKDPGASRLEAIVIRCD